MSQKVDLEIVKLCVQRNVDDVRRVAQILEDINQELAANAEERAPVVKKQHVVLLADPRGHLGGKDFSAWVVQIPEEDSAAKVESRLVAAAKDFNVTPKGRRLPLKTIGEVCEHIPSRFTKEQGVWVRTKEPVLVVATSGKI